MQSQRPVQSRGLAACKQMQPTAAPIEQGWVYTWAAGELSESGQHPHLCKAEEYKIELL